MHNDALSLAKTGDYLVLNFATEHHTDWDKDRMFVMAFVQHTETKFVEQVAWSKGQRSDVVVGIADETKSTTFRIYPNPSNGTIKIQSSFQDGVIELWDMTGQVVFSTSVDNSQTLDVSELSQGIYQAVLQREGGTQMQKIILH